MDNFRAVLIDPEDGTMRETGEIPWYWEMRFFYSRNVIVTHDDEQRERRRRREKGIKIFGNSYYGKVIVYPLKIEFMSNENFHNFLDYIDDHLYFVN